MRYIYNTENSREMNQEVYNTELCSSGDVFLGGNQPPADLDCPNDSTPTIRLSHGKHI